MTVRGPRWYRQALWRKAERMHRAPQIMTTKKTKTNDRERERENEMVLILSGCKLNFYICKCVFRWIFCGYLWMVSIISGVWFVVFVLCGWLCDISMVNGQGELEFSLNLVFWWATHTATPRRSSSEWLSSQPTVTMRVQRRFHNLNVIFVHRSMMISKAMSRLG